MEISKFDSKDSISTLIDEFRDSLKLNKYTPEIVTEFDLTLFLNFYRDHKEIYIARNNYSITGMLLGIKYTPDDLEELTFLHDPTDVIYALITKEKSLLETRNYNKSLFYIDRIESFKPREGIGTTLIDYIKNDYDSDIIFLRSANNSKEFYEKLGFRQFNENNNYPFMIWNR